MVGDQSVQGTPRSIPNLEVKLCSDVDYTGENPGTSRRRLPFIFLFEFCLDFSDS